jgi:hypothetical protein
MRKFKARGETYLNKYYEFRSERYKYWCIPAGRVGEKMRIGQDEFYEVI